MPRKSILKSLKKGYSLKEEYKKYFEQFNKAPHNSDLRDILSNKLRGIEGFPEEGLRGKPSDIVDKYFRGAYRKSLSDFLSDSDKNRKLILNKSDSNALYDLILNLKPKNNKKDYEKTHREFFLYNGIYEGLFDDDRKKRQISRDVAKEIVGDRIKKELKGDIFYEGLLYNLKANDESLIVSMFKEDFKRTEKKLKKELGTGRKRREFMNRYLKKCDHTEKDDIYSALINNI